MPAQFLDDEGVLPAPQGHLHRARRRRDGRRRDPRAGCSPPTRPCPSAGPRSTSSRPGSRPRCAAAPWSRPSSLRRVPCGRASLRPLASGCGSAAGLVGDVSMRARGSQHARAAAAVGADGSARRGDFEAPSGADAGEAAAISASTASTAPDAAMTSRSSSTCCGVEVGVAEAGLDRARGRRRRRRARAWAMSTVRLPSRRSSPAGLPVASGSPKTPSRSSRSWKAWPRSRP